MSAFKSVCLCYLRGKQNYLVTRYFWNVEIAVPCCSQDKKVSLSRVLINCCCNKDHKGNRKWHHVTLSPLTVKVAVMEHLNFVHSLETEEFIIVTGFSMHIVFLDVSNAISFHTASVQWNRWVWLIIWAVGNLSGDSSYQVPESINLNQEMVWIASEMNIELCV